MAGLTISHPISMQALERMSQHRRWVADEKRAMVETDHDPDTIVAEVNDKISLEAG